MSGRETTIVAVVTCTLAVMWFIIATYVAGLYFDCIPGDPEYGCLTANEQLGRSIVAIAAGLVLTAFIWVALRRASRIRRRG